MTLGLEAIKFMLEQDPDNLPIVQHWIDKWFWRGYRVLTLVAMMMDYMLPKKVMSWKEAWEIYAEENGGALFDDLARYGIRPPLGWQQACDDKEHLSPPGVVDLLPVPGRRAVPHLGARARRTWTGCREKYPDTFDKYYRPRFEYWAEQRGRRQPLQQRHAAAAVPGLPDPDAVHRAR